MDIGLTAKVEPEVDDRVADKEAGRLREIMNNAVESLQATANVDAIMDRLEDVKETAQNIQVDPTADTPTPTPPETVDTGADIGRFGMNQSPTPDMSPQERSSLLDRPEPSESVSMNVGEKVEKAKPLIQTASQTRSISGALSQLGNIFMEKGGLMILGGLGLVMLSRISEAVKNASPVLGQVLDMFGMAMKLFFRPFGNIIGRALMPIAAGLLQLAYEFNTIFSNQGFFAAFAWLGHYLVSNLAQGTMSFLGGSDDELGIADILANALRVGALYKLIKSFMAKGLLEPLMSTMRNFGSGSLLQVIKSSLPNLGIMAFASRIFPALTAGEIVTALGLRGALSLGGSRLAYLIPYVGQAIAIIDLLVYAITALIPGMEAFSPLVFTLEKGFGLLVSVIKGIIDAGNGFIDFLSNPPDLGDAADFLGGLMPDIDLGALLKGMLPSITAHGLISGMFAFVNSPGMSADTLLSHIFSFTGLAIADVFPVSGALQGDISIPGGMLDGVRDVLSSGFSHIVELLDSVDGFISQISLSGFPELLSVGMFVGALFVSLLEWVYDRLDSFVSKVVGWIDGAGDVFSGDVSFSDDILDGPVSFTDDILSGMPSFGNIGSSLPGSDAFDVSVPEVDVSLPDNVFGGNPFGDVNIVQDVFGGGVNILSDVFGGVFNVLTDLFNGEFDVLSELFNGSFNVLSVLFGGAFRVLTDLFDGKFRVLTDLFDGEFNVISDLFNGTINLVSELFKSGGDIDVVDKVFSGGFSGIQSFVANLFGGKVSVKKDVFGGAVDVVDEIFGGGVPNKGTLLRLLFGGTFVSKGSFLLSLFGDVTSIKPGKILDSLISNVPSAQDIVNHVFPDGVGGLLGGFERGGVVSSPTPAVVGEGGEPEYVVPQSKLEGFVSNVVQGDTGSSAVPSPTAFAEGGVVDSPTMALIGEAGETEYVVPESKLSAFVSAVQTGGNVSATVGDSVATATVDASMSQISRQSSSAVSNLKESVEMISTLLPRAQESISSVVDSRVVQSLRESSTSVRSNDQLMSETVSGNANSLTAFAEGGVVNGPTAALVGEGGESEAIVPFSKVDTFVESALSSSSDSIGPTPTPTSPPSPSVEISVESDSNASEIASSIRRELSSEFDELNREIQNVANEVSRMDIGSIQVTADGKVLAEITRDGEDKYRRNRQVTR